MSYVLCDGCNPGPDGVRYSSSEHATAPRWLNSGNAPTMADKATQTRTHSLGVMESPCLHPDSPRVPLGLRQIPRLW
jgi:hypothetical protein